MPANRNTIPKTIEWRWLTTNSAVNYNWFSMYANLMYHIE